MKKFSLSLLFLVLFPVYIFADVDIPKKYWVVNQPNGYCAYAAMETIGRFYGLKDLYQFERNGKTYSLMSWYMQWPSVGARSNDVHGCLTNLGISYEMLENADMGWLKGKLENKIPVVVGLPWGKGESHAIIVVDVKDGWVKYIDSNDTRGYWHVELSWFERNWTGWSIVIYNK